MVDYDTFHGEQTDKQGIRIAASMGENEEQQEEELEVLKSIYEGDDCYTSPDRQKHQYKFGEDSTSKSFLLGGYLGVDKMSHSSYLVC